MKNQTPLANLLGSSILDQTPAYESENSPSGWLGESFFRFPDLPGDRNVVSLMFVFGQLREVGFTKKTAETTNLELWDSKIEKSLTSGVFLMVGVRQGRI